MKRKLQYVFIFLLSIGAIALGTSFYVPCTYCKIERWGYFLLIPLSINGLIFKKKKMIIRIVQIILLAVLATSAAHTYKEFFGGVCSCTASLSKWKIFGITASFYSGIFSLGLISLLQAILMKDSSKA
ncbi:MAG: disulfide bond formation protein B [Simkaniaceae bacterium]|nr:disulfide bond formation protein B [Simkaniaceae bacterium]